MSQDDDESVGTMVEFSEFEDLIFEHLHSGANVS